MMSKACQNCLVLAVVAAATLGFAASTAPSANKPAATTQPKTKGYPPYPKLVSLNIGDAAPGFKLPGVDGTIHTLAKYKDAKILTIVFTCNHCPTSMMLEDAIIKLSTDYAKKGVKLVAISPNDPGALLGDDRPRRRSDPHTNRKTRPQGSSNATGENTPKTSPGRHWAFYPGSPIE